MDSIVLLDAHGTLSQVVAVLRFIGRRPFFAWNGAKPPKATVFTMSFVNLGVQYETELSTPMWKCTRKISLCKSVRFTVIADFQVEPI